jgi:hypothetical protein
MITDIQSFSKYASDIADLFVVDNNSIDLTKLGNRTTEAIITVNLKAPVLIDIAIAKGEFAAIITFIEGKCLPGYLHKKPIWCRINVLDQAVNDYIVCYSPKLRPLAKLKNNN